MDILTHIEQARVKKGLTKAELALKCNTNPDYYTRIITGSVPGVSHSIIERLCNAVGIKILYYIDIQDK